MRYSGTGGGLRRAVGFDIRELEAGGWSGRGDTQG